MRQLIEIPIPGCGHFIAFSDAMDVSAADSRDLLNRIATQEQVDRTCLKAKWHATRLRDTPVYGEWPH